MTLTGHLDGGCQWLRAGLHLMQARYENSLCPALVSLRVIPLDLFSR